MRTTRSLWVLALLASAVTWAADTDMQTDLMQAIEDANKSLSSNIALSNKQAAASDAQELTRMFADVESFFDHKADARNAVDLAHQSRELASQIVGMVNAGNFAEASNASTTLSRTCRTCHTFYKKE